MTEVTTNVPAIVADGFDNDQEDRGLIRGSIVRCVDGIWKESDQNSVPADSRWVAWATTECLQQWRDKLPVKTIMKKPGTPLPDVDELNAEIPQKEWETTNDGKPRPPWNREFVVYLLDAATGAELTFISGTVGAAIAVERLRRQTGNMRMLRGARRADRQPRQEIDDDEFREPAATGIYDRGMARVWCTKPGDCIRE